MTTLAYISDFSQPWYTPVHVARDAEAIGCTVERIDEREVAAHGLPFLGREYDLCIYTKHHGLPVWAHDLWRDLEDYGIRTASFHLDLYRGLARETEIGVDPFWSTQTVFSADGDPQTEQELALLGIRHRWLPAACVSDECVEVQVGRFDDRQLPGPFPEARVVFVGSTRSYHPEWPWRMEMLAALQQRYGSAFRPIGPQADGIVRGLQLNALFQTPGRIVVGDSLALPGHRNYFSDRYFETVGRGGFLIAPRVPGIEAFLTDGTHFVGYDPGDLPGLFGLIDGWLDHPDAARSIARAGQAHVRAHHTYQHRVRAMLAEVGLEVPA